MSSEDITEKSDNTEKTFAIEDENILDSSESKEAFDWPAWLLFYFFAALGIIYIAFFT